MKNNKFLLKAAQQALSECLGYDESRSYYFLLTKQDKELEQEFSYSKRYRILKNLFELGAVGKFKPEDQDFFTYLLLEEYLIAVLYQIKAEKILLVFHYGCFKIPIQITYLIL